MQIFPEYIHKYPKTLSVYICTTHTHAHKDNIRCEPTLMPDSKYQIKYCSKRFEFSALFFCDKIGKFKIYFEIYPMTSIFLVSSGPVHCVNNDCEATMMLIPTNVVDFANGSRWTNANTHAHTCRCIRYIWTNVRTFTPMQAHSHTHTHTHLILHKHLIRCCDMFRKGFALFKTKWRTAIYSNRIRVFF